MENLKENTAPCGIDCFNCEFFQTNIGGFFAAMDEQTKAAFASRGMTLEKTACKGCRTDGCKMLAGNCKTFKCISDKKLDFCYECGEFPCTMLQPMADSAQKVPHNLKVFNLMRIKNAGLEAWAKEAKEIRRKYFKGKFMIGAGPQG